MLRALHRCEQVGLRTGSDLATHTRGRQCSRKDIRLLERLTGVALQLHMGRSLGCLISGGEECLKRTPCMSQLAERGNEGLTTKTDALKELVLEDGGVVPAWRWN